MWLKCQVCGETCNYEDSMDIWWCPKNHWSSYESIHEAQNS